MQTPTPDNASLQTDSQWTDLIEGQIQRLEGQIASIGNEVAGVKADLSKNTAATMEVVSLLEAAKGAFKVLDGFGTVISWAGRLAAGLVALWAAFYALTHGGRPPGSH